MDSNRVSLLKHFCAVLGVAGFLALVPQPHTFPQKSETPEPVRSTFTSPPAAIAGPVDPDEYLVGPGDTFEVVLRGADLETHILEVDAEGSILIPEIGLVSLSGLTVTEARAKVQQRVTDVARSLRVDFTLQRVREVRVWVSGLVEEPGFYEVQATMRVSDILELAVKRFKR